MLSIENNWLDMALGCETQEQIEEWVHKYLCGSGNNIPLSDGLKLAKRYWIGPMKYRLDALERICGPEEHMEFRQDAEGWEIGIQAMMESLEKGWTPAPFILTFDDKGISLRDGNHRYEALKRMGHEEHWVFIWCNNEKDYEYLMQEM